MTEITDLSPTDASNTSITGESLDGNVANMGRMDNTLQAILGMVARSIRTNIWRVLDNSDDTKELALDLSGVTTATTRTLTVPDASGTIAITSDLTSLASKVDTRRNRIVNHDMRVSQENGTGSGTANGYYAADQWATYRVTSAGTITSQRVASITPAGAQYRYSVTITTGDASLAAGEYLTITTNLEGSNVIDFLYGFASARNSVLRFGFKGPAGTYAVALHNSGATRSYVALFTIAGGDANTETVQEIAIPGDTTGTWLTADGVIGITLDIVLACGSTFQGTTGWQAGNVLGTSAVSNGMGTGGAVFELFDVGLKLDPDDTGVYGQYEVGEEHPKFNPRRYLRRMLYGTMGRVTISTAFTLFVPLEPLMAKTPNIFFQGGLTMDNGAAAVTANTPSVLSLVGNVSGFRAGIGGFSGLSVGADPWSAATTPMLIQARLS